MIRYLVYIRLNCSNHDAGHFWSDSKFLLMTVVMASSEKSCISGVLSVEDMSSWLALIKLRKARDQGYGLEDRTPVLVSRHQIHIV